ncbi:MAG: GFA family protein [Rhodoblastus sp.]|nr:GFA family protein [Rhodoblastus sp.]
MAFQGSCLCSAIRYEISGLDTPIGHCHCSTCRKAHASSFTSTARVSRDNFKFTAGGDQLRGFESSPGKFRRFCGTCGSHIYAEWVDQPQIILRVATLDEDPGARPLVHIWTSHDPPWLMDQADVRRFAEGLPLRR